MESKYQAVFKTSDGLSIKAISPEPEIGIIWHASVYHDNKIILIGGIDDKYNHH